MNANILLKLLFGMAIISSAINEMDQEEYDPCTDPENHSRIEVAVKGKRGKGKSSLAK